MHYWHYGVILFNFIVGEEVSFPQSTDIFNQERLGKNRDTIECECNSQINLSLKSEQYIQNNDR